jgi:hypothetical protein
MTIDQAIYILNNTAWLGTEKDRANIEQAVWMVKNVIERSKWIPCSERLPERKGEYLVTYRPCYWDNVENEIKVGIDSFRGKTSWAKKKYQKVIAWIPFPEPYKEEGEQE